MNVLTLFQLNAADTAQIKADPRFNLVQPNDDLSVWGPQIDVILGWNQIGQQIIDGKNRVKFVQTMSAGVDYLPLGQLAVQHILVANTSGIHAEPIAEWVVGAILAFARGLRSDPPLTAANWADQSSLTGSKRPTLWTLPGKTVLIYGTGHIGRRIAQQLQAFGATIWGIDRHGQPLPHFDRVGRDKDSATFAQNADIIINVMPLTDATRDFFDAGFFSGLTNHPLFINVGRGPSVDSAAIAQALTTGLLSGAALDVTDPEPLPADSPLWQAPHLLLTAHISGTVPNLQHEVFKVFWPNLQQLAQKGNLVQNEVDLKRGY